MMKKDGHKITPEEKMPRVAWVRPYLETLAQVGLKMAAARIVKVNYSTVRGYRANHPEFKEEAIEAVANAIELAEMALRKRGMIGDEEPLTYKGKLTGDKILKKSTTALIAFLNANSEKYRRNRTGDASSPDDHPEPDLRYI